MKRGVWPEWAALVSALVGLRFCVKELYFEWSRPRFVGCYCSEAFASDTASIATLFHTIVHGRRGERYAGETSDLTLYFDELKCNGQRSDRCCFDERGECDECPDRDGVFEGRFFAVYDYHGVNRGNNGALPSNVCEAVAPSEPFTAEDPQTILEVREEIPDSQRIVTACKNDKVWTLECERAAEDLLFKDATPLLHDHLGFGG